MKRYAALLSLVCAMGLAGCDNAPAPSSVPVTHSTLAPPLGCASSLTVNPGDTVYSVARRCGVTVRELIEANALQPPYALVPGSSLRMPGATPEIIVSKGDTLRVLARKYHVDFNAFAAANHKTPPYIIKVGEHLRLPGSFVQPPMALTPAPKTVVAEPLPPQTGSTPPVTAPPPPPPKPMVSDTLPPQALPPPVAAPKPAPPAAASPPAAPPLPALAAAPPPTPVAAAPVAPPPPLTNGTKGFIWPVKGEILVSFGPQAAKGQNNDGINIAASKGTPIMAVEAGSVAYVGNELKGFGNLVLIKHADGWVSAYAHADQVLVKKGQTVTRGQQIGTVGQTGSVTQSQLHFELRHQGEAVDPEEYFPG